MTKDCHDSSNDEKTSKHTLVANLDSEVAQIPALTESQRADVDKLRNDMIGFLDDGELEDAKRCLTLALGVIRQGQPVPE